MGGYWRESGACGAINPNSISALLTIVKLSLKSNAQYGVAPPTSSPLMWLSVLLRRYRCQLDVNGRFTYYLNHLAPLCAALRRSRVSQFHQGVVGGVPKPSYSLLS